MRTFYTASLNSFFLSPILRNADGSKPRGASTQLSFTDVNGLVRSRTLITGGQTCPGPDSPEVNVGLGRLSTYIDYVAVGLPGGGSERIWSNLIPNATFYLTIHLPEDPTSWRLHWSVPPLKLFWPMLLATLVALGFVGFLLKVSDRRKRQMRERLGIRRHFIV